MIFSIIIILSVGLVAYFHYTQGFFSATLSAMIAIMAALVAISYHETVVRMLLKGKMADVADSMVLCMIFAVTYLVLRTLFDAAIPGNVRTPSIVDKIGAGLMGFVAGVFVLGIFAIAVQKLPFGPTLSFLGYSRYATTDNRNVIVAPSEGNHQMLDAVVHDELIDTAITGDADSRGKQKGLMLPVDEWVLATAYHISNGGSLAGDHTLASVHPDLLQEIYGERLGQQEGARRSALNFGTGENVSLGGVFSVPALPAADGEVKDLRQDFKIPAEIKSDRASQILVVRVNVRSQASDDSDGFFRFSTGSIHLVSHSTDYYPIGILENAHTVLIQKPDDFLFTKGDSSIDLVFKVDNDVFVGGKPNNTVADGTFVSVKRFGLVNLAGETISETIPAPTGNSVIRSKNLLDQLKLPPAAPADRSAAPAAAPQSPAAAPQPAAVEPAKTSASATVTVSGTLAFSVGCKTENNDDPSVPVAGGTISLKGGNISAAAIDPTDLTELAKGDSQLKELAAPEGFKLVQVVYTTTGDPYAWVAQNGAIQVADANNNFYKANGFIVRLNQGTDKVLVRFDMNRAQFAVPAISGGTPTSTTFLFVVRGGTHLASLQVGPDSTPISVDVP